LIPSQKKLRDKEKQKNIKRLLDKLENIEKRKEAEYNLVPLQNTASDTSTGLLFLNRFQWGVVFVGIF